MIFSSSRHSLKSSQDHQVSEIRQFGEKTGEGIEKKSDCSIESFLHYVDNDTDAAGD